MAIRSACKAFLRNVKRMTVSSLLMMIVSTPEAFGTSEPISQIHPEISSNPRILVLHSYHHGFTWTDNISKGIQSVLDRHAPEVEVLYEFMDVKRLDSKEYFQQLVSLYIKKYHNQKINLIISCDDHALNFLLGLGKDLFPEVPIIFCAVNGYDPVKHGGDGRQLTGIVESIDIQATLDLALKLQPDTKEVAYVTDGSLTGKALKRSAENVFKNYRKKLRFRYLEHKTMEQLQNDVALLADDTIVMAFIFSRDHFGRIWSHEYNLSRMASSCNVPIYSVWEFYLGHGIVGGMLTSGETQGKMAAEMALRVLGGERVSAIPVVTKSPNRYMFDDVQLRRFHVKRSELPKESIVINRPHSIYEHYKGHIWGILVVICFLSTLVVILTINIFKRKRAEKALRESEEKYRVLIENANDALFVAQDGVIKFPNPITKDMTGYSEEELEETPFTDFVHPEDRDMVLDRYRRRMSGEKFASTYSFRILNRSGNVLCVELNAVRIEWEGRPATLNFIRDITQQRKLETQLQQAQKMESLGTLAGGIAHDFNNILSPIILHSEMAMMELASNHPVQFNLKQIFRAGERARDMVKQILAFSRQREPEKIAIKMGTVLKEVVKLLRSSIPTTIHIIYDMETERDTIFADPTQIHQVILNLCTNASHAMREKGGTLMIDLNDVHLDSDGVRRFSDLSPGDYIRLTVRDTGEGIPPEVMDRIFEPYFTTKGPGEGTGMGLAVAHGIVRSHGGEIICESELGKGTVFRVFFPGYDAGIVEDSEGSVQLPHGTERILFVDDEMDAINSVKPMLEKLGYTVRARTSSIEALEAFRNNPKGFDLVITDMTMPNMTGKELAQKLMSIRPDIPVILCTGFSEQIDERKAKVMGIGAFVMKPIVMTEMSHTIRKVLDTT
ncbi:MAG: PAS domain S-box protein [Deltaproteobacteria bacterium]|nr:PAS domain S-box protein [Deltaproteobacteria bacterium]